jgi:hypothetical protein
LVAMLGSGVRVWRSRQPAKQPTSGMYGSGHSAPDSKRPAEGAKPRRTSVRGRSATSRTGQINRDSDLIVDLDRATAGEIDALGLLPKGMSRLIVADRDSFGPFGSLDELRRVPFLTASTLRKLAPRVKFSRLPWPRNTVINPRAPVSTSTRRGVRGEQ